MPDFPDEISSNERKLLIRAAADFSDACDLPELTPECPFYEVTNYGPSCAEQCRDLIERYPDDLVRPVETSLGTGITAVRRPRPRRGPEPESKSFDAREYLLVDRPQPVSRWRTPSLLVELRDQLVAPVSATATGSSSEIVRELGRRGIDGDALFAQQFVMDWAVGIFLRVATDEASKSNRFEEWGALARGFAAANKSPGGGDELEEQLELGLDPSLIAALVSWGAEIPFDEILGGRRPTLNDLLAVNLVPPPNDKDTRWLTERFTQTYLSDWREESLIEEWRYMHSLRRACCAPAVMQERRIDANELAKELANRVSDREQDELEQTDRTLDLSQFAPIALDALRVDNYADAVGIYRALANLRPLDYEVLNNLGFCLIPENSSEAVAILERCAQVGGSNTTLLTYLNLARAQIREGLSAAAAATLERARTAPDPDTSAWVWTLAEPPVIEYENSLLTYALRVADHLSG